jgi:membrane protease YdiL (CAAX protease family)
LKFIDILVGRLLRRILAIQISLNSLLVRIAWGITVALAVAPEVAATRVPSLLRWALFTGLLCAAMVPFLWKPARPLRTYAGMLVLLMLLAVFFWSALPTWMSRRPWFPDPSGYAAAFIIQAPKVVAAFVMMAVLALLGYRRQEFFVASGAHAKLSIASGVVAALVMGFTMVVYLQTTAAEAKGAAGTIRYLPLALVLAVMNSFAEEMLYHGVLLAPLLRQMTANHAISMTAVLLGIAHYHGTPSGFPGVGLTFIAGWVFGLAMVETRSILLPWFLHFVPDAVIFVTSALQN